MVSSERAKSEGNFFMIQTVRCITHACFRYALMRFRSAIEPLIKSAMLRDAGFGMATGQHFNDA